MPALVLLVHAPALSAYFEADDFLWVIHHDWADGWHALTGNWGLGTAYRPLTRLSFLLDARLFGWNAAPWHAANLALHAVNAVLLAVLLRQAGFRARDAALASAMFAVLPLDWENVDWISGRTGLLCLGFMLGAAIFCVRSGAERWNVVGAGLCQALALLCYEPAVILPLALAVLIPVLGRTGFQRSRLAVCAGWLAGVGVAVWLMRWVLLGSARLATDVAGNDYLKTLGFDVLSLGAHAGRDFGWAGFCGATALLVCGLSARRHRAGVACLLACCAVLYLPFTPVAGFTERFAYLATAPLACALTLSAVSLHGGRAALCVLGVLLAFRSHAQAEGFRHAGDVTRALLTHIAAIPDDGRNLVFDGVPTHDGPYYLLWANFEDAVAARRPATGFAATSDWVLRNPGLLRRALAGNTVFLAYDGKAEGFSVMPQTAWQARHGLGGVWR